MVVDVAVLREGRDHEGRQSGAVAIWSTGGGTTLSFEKVSQPYEIAYVPINFPLVSVEL